MLCALVLGLIQFGAPASDSVLTQPAPRVVIVSASAPAAKAPLDGKDDLEAALAALKRASQRDLLEARLEALRTLVALADPDAIEPVLERFSKAAALVEDAQQELAELAITIDRRRVQLAELALAVERNPDLKQTVAKYEQELVQLEQRSAKLAAVLALDGPWSAALRRAAVELLDAQATSRRRGLVKGLWKTVEKGDQRDRRLAAAQLVADLAEPGTAVRIARVMLAAYAEQSELRVGLPVLEAKVREWGRKAQAELQKFGGLTKGTAGAYQRVQNEAARLNREVTAAGAFAADLRAAAAAAIAHQASDTRANEAAKILKLGSKSPQLLELLGVVVDSGAPEVAPVFLAMLAKRTEPLLAGALVDGLAELGPEANVGLGTIDWLLASGLTAESWHLRARAVAALAELRAGVAIGPLLERFEIEEGRLRTDVEAALVALTGMDFNGNAVLWRRWWEANAEGFVVPDEPPASSEEQALEQVGLTFFGLRTESQRVLFVLDVSGSMEFPMQTYEGGGGAGETRITVAKRELLRALGGIEDGGTFNFVLYATDVWTWQDAPVTMDADARAEATAFIEALKPVGATNIYGALQLGLEQARGKARKRGAPRWMLPAYDTLFLLSDGQPSAGLSIKREEILGMVAEENRDLGIVIHTIGLSTEQDAVLMRSLAEQNGGIYAAR